MVIKSEENTITYVFIYLYINLWSYYIIIVVICTGI